MLGTQYQSVKEARQEAIKLSKASPKMYYTIFSCFGLYIEESKRLHIFAPGDSCHPYYFNNGKEKPFTEAQIIAEQIATPTMS